MRSAALSGLGGSLLIAVASQAVAQTAAPIDRPLARWQHTTWSAESDLPRYGAHLPLISPDGYLWLSARRSLIRFDGVQFMVFDSTTSPALRTTSAGEFLPWAVDRRGVMWIVGPDGQLIAYENGNLRIVLPAGSAVASSVTSDSAGRIWIRTSEMRAMLDGKFVESPLPKSIDPRRINVVRADTGRGHWVGTDDGLLHVVDGVVTRIGSGQISPMLQSRDGRLWAVGSGLGGGTWHYDGKRWTPLILPGGTKPVFARSAREGPDGSVWISSNIDGLVRWRAGRIERFTEADGLSSDRMSAVVAFDEDGAVWATTQEGIDRLRPSSFMRVDSLIEGASTSLGEIATDASGALWMISRSRQLLRLDSGLVRPRGLAWEASRVPTPDVFGGRFVAPSREGVWLLTRPNRLMHRTRTAMRVYGAAGLPEAQPLAALEGRDGALWLAYGPEFGRLRDGRYRTVDRPDCNFPVGALLSFAEDARGDIWAACGKHGPLMIIRGDSVIDTVSVPGLGVGVINRIVHEGGDTLWFTSSSRVHRIIGRRVDAVDVKGISSVLEAQTLAVLAQGQLWLASVNGIVRLPLKALHGAADGTGVPVRAEFLDALDGLPRPRLNRLNPRALHAGADGRVWVVARSGLAVSDGFVPPGVARAPEARVDEVRVNGRVFALDAQDNRSVIGQTLSSRDDRLEIRFSAPHLSLARRVLVEYRLEGVDADWRSDSLTRVAQYSRLDPGDYRFRVRAWSPDGSRFGQEALVDFSVKAVWHESAWFRAVILFAATAIAFAVAVTLQRRRARFEAARMRREFDAVLTERTRIAGELHDTLLQGIAGITLHLEGVRGKLPRDSAVTAALADIVGRAEHTLREARAMVWDIRSAPATPRPVHELLRSLASEVIGSESIIVTCEHTGEPRLLGNELEHAILRVAREALLNAVKHAEPRSISIVLHYERERVTLEVRDDGKGTDGARFSDARAEGHFGVAGMHERARRAGGTLTLHSAPGRGTQLRLTLPSRPLNTQQD